MSKPLFKKGDLVKFNQDFVNQMLESRKKLLEKGYTSKDLGELPIGSLFIWSEPRIVGNTWMYDYEYGHVGASEGSALESNLVLYKL